MEHLSDNRITYQCTEPDPNMQDSLLAWINDTASRTESKFRLPVIPLDVNRHESIPLPVPENSLDVVICINMIHISPWQSTLSLLQFVSKYLKKDEHSFLFTYGPYSVGGEMVESNRAFSKSLQERDPSWGVRDVDDIRREAAAVGLEIAEMVPMPSNNFSLIFRRQ
jgi:SAM-dependent methyltransferase